MVVNRINKSQFVEYINFIRSLREKEDEFNKGLSLCFGEMNVSNIFVYAEVETEMIKMLCDLMGVKYNNNDEFGDVIQYYIYDLEFGTNFMAENCIECNGVIYSLTTPEELYDYIIDSQATKEVL